MHRKILPKNPMAQQDDASRFFLELTQQVMGMGRQVTAREHIHQCRCDINAQDCVRGSRIMEVNITGQGSYEALKVALLASSGLVRKRDDREER